MSLAALIHVNWLDLMFVIALLTCHSHSHLPPPQTWSAPTELSSSLTFPTQTLSQAPFWAPTPHRTPMVALLGYCSAWNAIPPLVCQSASYLESKFIRSSLPKPHECLLCASIVRQGQKWLRHESLPTRSSASNAADTQIKRAFEPSEGAATERGVGC